MAVSSRRSFLRFLGLAAASAPAAFAAQAAPVPVTSAPRGRNLTGRLMSWGRWGSPGARIEAGDHVHLGLEGEEYISVVIERPQGRPAFSGAGERSYLTENYVGVEGREDDRI